MTTTWKDHEHCVDMGKCWQDAYPCPALLREKYLAMQITREQENTVERLCAEHGGECRVSHVSMMPYGMVANVRCRDGYSCRVTEGGEVR